MRLGNGRPPHILPPQAGVFPPPVRLRSRGALLPVTPSPAQLTVQGNCRFQLVKFLLYVNLNAI